MWKRLAFKLTIPTLSMFIIVSLIATYVGGIFFRKNMLENLYGSFDHYYIAFNEVIKDVIEKQEEINYVLVNSSSLSEKLAGCDNIQEDSCQAVLKKIFSGITGQLKNIGFNFYDKDLNLIFSSSNYMLSRFNAKNYLSTKILLQKSFGYVYNDGDSLYISVFTPVVYDDKTIGWVMSYVPFSLVLQEFKGISRYDFVLIRDNYYNLLFTNVPSELQKILTDKNAPLQNKLGKYVYKKYPVSVEGSKIGTLFMFTDFRKYSDKIQMFLKYLLLFAILALILGGIIYYMGITKTVVTPIKRVRKSILDLAKEKTAEKIKVQSNDEIGEIVGALNQLIDNFKSIANYADELGKGNYEINDDNITKESLLGSSLIRMKENLKKAKKLQEEKQKEEKIRHWVAEGLAKFSDILRKYNDDDKKTFDELIKELVNYMGVEQGAILIMEGDENEKYLKIMSTFAYGRHKFREERIELGEGIAGEVAIEGMSIYIDDLPEDYPAITSGLGEAKPRYLFVVPLKLENEVFGIIELASFHYIDDYKREFVEKLGESIASVLKNIKVNRRTKELLTMFQEQSEVMRAQEEELKQNLEELQATQEDLLHKERDFNALFNAIDKNMIRIGIDKNFNIESVNEMFINTMKFNSSEIIGVNITYILQDGNKWQEYLHILESGKIVKERFKFKTSAGESLEIKVFIIPFLNDDGDIEKMMIIGLV